MSRYSFSTKRNAAIVILLQDANVGTRQLGWSSNDSSSQVAKPRTDRKKTAPELKRRSSQSMGDFWKMDFKSFISRNKPLITEKERRSRRLWGEEHRQWIQAHWAKILWSDESSFQLCPNRANVRARRRCGEEYIPACTVATVKHGGGSILDWGSMSARGVGELTVCEGMTNSPNYCQMLEHQMFPSARVLFNHRRAQHWIFQQEYPLYHTARTNKTWMNEHGVQLLDWAALSSDMSPIENLWCIIKTAVSERKPRNIQELGRLWSTNGIILR